VDSTQAEELTLAHWLVNGADGGRLFVRCFGGVVGPPRTGAVHPSSGRQNRQDSAAIT
jgi:hypothetical protein